MKKIVAYIGACGECFWCEPRHIKPHKFIDKCIKVYPSKIIEDTHSIPYWCPLEDSDDQSG